MIGEAARPHDHQPHYLETLAANVLGQDVGRDGYAGVLLRGVLGADEDAEVGIEGM